MSCRVVRDSTVGKRNRSPMIELDGRAVINIVVAIIDTTPPAIKRIIERYYTVTKRKRAPIDIVDAATKASVRCTIVRDFAIVQCKRTMIIENAAASECGVARDPAIDDIDRTSVITDTTTISLLCHVTRDNTVIDREYAHIANTTGTNICGITRDRTIVEDEYTIITDTTTSQELTIVVRDRTIVVRDRTIIEGERTVISDTTSTIIG